MLRGMGTVFPGVIALAIGFALSVAALVPWIAREYRTHGQLRFRRSLVAFGALVYALALLTYTLLPLPADVSTMCQASAGPQLRPFSFLADIAKEGGISGPRSLVSNPAAAQVIFNVLLFLPLGAFAKHALARHRLLMGLLAGFGAGLVVSLLIETTQLTGDWFLYPCSYRLFDVDDLFANTAGALLGTLLAPLVGLLAGASSASTDDAEAPRPVTAARRFSGILSDVLAIWLVSAAISLGMALAWTAAGGNPQSPQLTALVDVSALVAPLLQLVIVLVSGRTLGEHVVRLRPRPVPNVGKRLARWALGSGGWATLLALGFPFSGFLAFCLAIASIIAVWKTRAHRGLALALTGIEIEDERVAVSPQSSAD